MSKDFYNRVAREFGRYSSGVEIIKEFPKGEPEKIFREFIVSAGGPDVTALDVGCADGRFTLTIAPDFKSVVALDFSEGMIDSAKKYQQEQGIANVDFRQADFFNNGIPHSSFDVAYSRRGPTNYPEFARLLKSGGRYFEIEIGNMDTFTIKKVFGRGQNYGQEGISVLETIKKGLVDAGFHIDFLEQFEYNEFYKTPEDLSTFLESVPIFEDYDPQIDAGHLAQYISANTSKRGIVLPRHRVVVAATKE